MIPICQDKNRSKYDGNKESSNHCAKVNGQKIIRGFPGEFFYDMQ
jgi:hypothetical protein